MTRPHPDHRAPVWAGLDLGFERGCAMSIGGKERIRLPETYVDRLLSSRYAQHFYTAEERAQIRTRWVRA